MADDSITQKERLQVLLAEYATLRAEMISRGNAIIQLVTIGIASLAVVAASIDRLGPILAALLLAILLSVIVTLRLVTYRDIIGLAKRLRELEEEINKSVGEDLLKWETHYGAAVVGIWAGIWGFLARPDSKK